MVILIIDWFYIALFWTLKNALQWRGDLTHHHQCVALTWVMHSSQSEPHHTHQLEVESEGISESANYTGWWLVGQIEWAWLGSFSQDTRVESPTLCNNCPVLFHDLSESGPLFYTFSKGRHLPQHSVPVTALGYWGLMFRPEGRVQPTGHHPTPLPAATQSSHLVSHPSTSQAHTCLASEIQQRQAHQ